MVVRPLQVTLWRHLQLLCWLLRSTTPGVPSTAQGLQCGERLASPILPVVARRLAGFLASKKLAIKDLVRPPYSQLGIRWMQQAGQSTDASAMVGWKGVKLNHWAGCMELILLTEVATTRLGYGVLTAWLGNDPACY